MNLQKKADRLLQEKGREKYSKCEVCGGKMSCLHHFFPKSTASALRYDWDNLVAICQSCHFRHHNGDPRPHATVMLKRGEQWYKRLLKKKSILIKTNKKYYETIIKCLNE